MQVCHIGSWNMVVGACSTMILELQITTYKLMLYFFPFQKPLPCLQVLHLCCVASILFIFGLCVCNFVTSFCSQICVLLFSLCVFLLLLFFCVLGKLLIDLHWQNKLKLCYWNIIFSDHASPYSNWNNFCKQVFPALKWNPRWYVNVATLLSSCFALVGYQCL